MDNAVRDLLKSATDAAAVEFAHTRVEFNEDCRTVDSERRISVTYTTSPIHRDTEITGPVTATLWPTNEEHRGKDSTGMSCYRGACKNRFLHSGGVECL